MPPTGTIVLGFSISHIVMANCAEAGKSRYLMGNTSHSFHLTNTSVSKSESTNRFRVTVIPPVLLERLVASTNRHGERLVICIHLNSRIEVGVVAGI